jgi:Cu(I)/Ag(I) efflux system membrane fusion protein
MKKLKFKNIISTKYLAYVFVLISGILLGRAFFHPADMPGANAVKSEAPAIDSIWTCAMHPQIRMSHPGKCPICGMDLIPLVRGGSSSADPGSVHFTKEAAELANVETTIAEKKMPYKEIRLYGKIEADERRVQSQVSHVSGRIEKLYVNFTGETVKRGQPLARLYSPDIVSAEQELIEASELKKTQPGVYEAAREKLRQWKLTEEQIDAIERTGAVQETTDVVSNTDGVILSKMVNTGDYVSRGTELFRVADLSEVWALFDAYEDDIPFLHKGDKVTFTLRALPGSTFSGRIVFIDPVLDPVTRIARVRVEAINSSGIFKPGMFATGVIEAGLKQYTDNLVIPRSAVLWTGRRSIVYVKQKDTGSPVFRLREVTLGPSLGDSYIVTEGLSAGEEIVTNGTFSVDAAAQLEGKPSMMDISNPGSMEETDRMPGNMTSRAMKTSVPADDHTNTVNTRNNKITGKSFMVSGRCEMCRDRIDSAALSVAGVHKADWDLNSRIVTVEFDSTMTSVKAIQKAIANAGHDTELFKADDVTYESLPECCHYRN